MNSLHWSAFRGYDLATKALINRKVDLDIKAKNLDLLDSTALFIALKFDSNVWESKHAERTEGYRSIISDLVDAGANPEIVSKFRNDDNISGLNCFHRALFSGEIENIQKLLSVKN